MTDGRPQGLLVRQSRVAGVLKQELQRRRFDVAAANPNGIESFSPALADVIGLVIRDFGSSLGRDIISALKNIVMFHVSRISL